MPFESRPKIRPHAHDWHMLEWYRGYNGEKKQASNPGEDNSSWVATKFICLICDEIKEIK